MRSVEELLASNSIQLVVIATPNVSHFDLARQCLLAGRHVVIDKPFATTYAEAAVSLPEGQALWVAVPLHNELESVEVVRERESAETQTDHK